MADSRDEFNGPAAVMSFLIPGLGQIYRGQVAVGFLFLFGTLAGLWLFIVPGLIVWIFGILHAGRGPSQIRRKGQRQRPARRQSARERLIQDRREPVDGAFHVDRDDESLNA